MKSAYSTLMQSRFFHPAFNSAIFDGPVRIYFSQIHESLALKIYFSLQQKSLEALNQAKAISRDQGKNILIMLYPNQETFQMSFETPGFLIHDNLDGDALIGINGPFEDERLADVLTAFGKAVSELENEKPSFEQAVIV
jgi:hypothetical protein